MKLNKNHSILQGVTNAEALKTMKKKNAMFTDGMTE
jgi:hypothetical protein